MKALICGNCMTIIGLPQDDSQIECRCGNARARWIDPTAGTVEVDATEREHVRILGLHNAFLISAFTDPVCTTEQWRGRHTLCVDGATFEDGGHENPFAASHRFSGSSIFSYDQRRCWAAIIRPGETADVTWATIEAADAIARPVNESS